MKYKSMLRFALVGTLTAILLVALGNQYGLAILEYFAVAIFLGLAGLAVSGLSFFGRYRMRTTRPPSQGFWAVSGLGAIFLLMLSVPVLALILFFTGPLLLLPDHGTMFLLALFTSGLLWLVFAGRAFAVFYLEPAPSGLATYWPRLNTANFKKWDEVKLFHLFGPVFAVGIPWLFPATWFVVRRHRLFLKGIHGHLS